MNPNSCEKSVDMGRPQGNAVLFAEDSEHPPMLFRALRSRPLQVLEPWQFCRSGQIGREPRQAQISVHRVFKLVLDDDHFAAQRPKTHRADLVMAQTGATSAEVESSPVVTV